MKTHRNIPFFVPFAGCPNRCAFCAQEKITGKSCEKLSLTEEIAALRSLVEASSGGECMLAFFGGSFTAIPGERMIALLKVGQEYIKSGAVTGIRISTRPDCIDREILDILAEYGVTNIELGVQSMSDVVLGASKRGCLAADNEAGCRLVASDSRFVLGGQMMVGLPCSSERDEISTAKAICAFGAKEARIYPTVVFKGTELYSMTLNGEYTPLSTEDAVGRCASCMEVFGDFGVKLLRVGLQSGEELAEAPFGASHPAIGELAAGELLYRRVQALIPTGFSGGKLVITLPRGQTSKLTGHGGAAITRLTEKYMLTRIIVREGDLPPMTVRVDTEV